MHRRDFLKSTCTVCLLIGSGWLVGSMEACSTAGIYKTTMKDNMIVLPASAFESESLRIVRASGMDYDIAVRKEADGSYSALLLRCTHADNPLNTTGNGFYCTLHGSTFDAEGNVTKGPAARPLKRFHTQLKEQQVIIHIS